jgi:hypothetical protein
MVSTSRWTWQNKNPFPSEYSFRLSLFKMNRSKILRDEFITKLWVFETHDAYIKRECIFKIEEIRK